MRTSAANSGVLTANGRSRALTSSVLHVIGGGGDARARGNRHDLLLVDPLAGRGRVDARHAKGRIGPCRGGLGWGFRRDGGRNDEGDWWLEAGSLAR